MFHKTLTILSLIGLLLSMGLWGVSYWDVFWMRADRRLVVTLWRSSLYIEQRPPYTIGTALNPGLEVRGYVGLSRTAFRLPRYKSFLRASEITVPLWIPCLAFAALPAYSLLTLCRRSRKRKKLGLCVKCGYDLRASKERGPECGQEKQE